MEKMNIDFSKKWLIMASVGMGLFLCTIDSSIVNVALPTMVRYFNTDFATVQWVVLSYLLTATTLILSASRLADINGKKPIYTIGFIVFTIGSFLCGLAPTVHLLIAARVFQGIGATMVTALGMAIITEAFPPQERGKALGISGAIISTGIVLGPTVGGMILEHLPWNWIFFINLPIGVIGTLMVIRFVPNFKPSDKQKFDYLGAVFLFICLFSLLFALTYGQQNGFTNLMVYILLFLSVLFLAIFIFTELKISEPMIELRLFQSKLFSINLITRVMTFFAMSGTIILMPFYLENILHHTPQEIGLMMASVPVAMGLISPLSGMLSDRFGSRSISIVGLSILLVGFIFISTLSETTTTFGYLIRFIPVGIGMGIFQSPNNSAVMGSAPRNRLGIASGILAITRTLGQTAGISIMGALWASQTFRFAGEVIPEGATYAPIPAQISGLHSTFYVTCVMLAVGLGLSIWAFVLSKENTNESQSSKPVTHQQLVKTSPEGEK